MASLRNISQSALSVPALDGRTVDMDEVVEVPNEVARGFVGQDGTWQVELDDERAEEPAPEPAPEPQPQQPPRGRKPAGEQVAKTNEEASA